MGSSVAMGRKMAEKVQFTDDRPQAGDSLHSIPLNDLAIFSCHCKSAMQGGRQAGEGRGAAPFAHIPSAVSQSVSPSNWWIWCVVQLHISDQSAVQLEQYRDRRQDVTQEMEGNEATADLRA